MRRLTATTLALGLALSAAAAAPSQQRADVDHEVAVAIGESVSVAGGVPQGINPTPTTADNTGLICSHNPNEYCETILVHLTNPYEEENAKKGRERANADFVLTTTDGVASDYDLYFYASDADGTKGDELGSAGQFPLLAGTSTETATLVITSTEDVEEAWVLVEVYYFSAIAPYELSLDFA